MTGDKKRAAAEEDFWLSFVSQPGFNGDDDFVDCLVEHTAAKKVNPKKCSQTVQMAIYQVPLGPQNDQDIFEF